MTKGNNSILIEACVSEFGAEIGRDLPADELFELFAATMVTKKLQIDSADLEDANVDGGRDGGIDTFLLLVDDQPVSSLEDVEITRNSVVDVLLIQSKGEDSFREQPLDKLLASLPMILNLGNGPQQLSKHFNEAVIERVQLLSELRKAVAKRAAKIRLKIYYVTLSNDLDLSEVQKAKADQLKEAASAQMNGADVTFEFVSAKELFAFYGETPPQTFTLKFKQQPQTVTYGGQAQGYVGVALLADFVGFLKDESGVIRDDLFESNVRHFQGENEVNKGIKASIEGNLDHDFWWLNNGVTIICDHAGFVNNESLSLANPQIVNGLQTSYTLARNFKSSAEDKRSVLVKVIQSDDKETQDKVIASTNRQTQVNIESLKATEEFQRTLEKLFEFNGYYYERRKNFHKNMGKSADRIFSIKQVAQAVYAIKFRQPATARSRPSSLLKTHYARIFNENISHTVYLNCALLHRQVTNFVKKLPDKDARRQERNYLYHLSRALSSFITETAYPNDEDLTHFDPLNVKPETAAEALGFLRDVRKQFLAADPTMNIISAAKKNDLVELIDKELRNRFGGGIADKE